jgi:hypothetical protein
MGALLIIFLGAVYVLIAYKVTVRVRPWWGKTIAIAVFVLIPTADAVYGRIKFNQMCETEAGLKIYRTAEDAQGFYNSQMPPSDQWIRKYGYRFIEGRALGGKDARMSLRPDGTILLETEVMPISKYAYEVKRSAPGETYSRTEQNIRMRETNEVLSAQVNISYAGGWFNRFVASLYASRGQAGICGPGISIDDLVTKTLKPVK